MKKLMTLLTMLIVAISASAAVSYSGDAPATKTYAEKTFLDVINTTTNASISSTVKTFAIDMNYLVRTWQPAWVSITSGSPSNSSGQTGTGFLATASGSTYDAYTQSYGYAKVKSAAYVDFYVTGITGIAIINKDNTQGSKYVQIQVAEVANDGTLGTVKTTSSNNTSIHITEYAGSTLEASKYYKVTIIGVGTTGMEVYQIRFTQGSATTHKVTYDLGDATDGTAPSPTDVAEGSKFTVAEAPADLVAPTGKEFKCWNDGTDDYIAGAEYTMGESDVEFTAVYQNETIKYAVSYAAGEGSGSMTGTEKAEGAEFYLPASTFTVPEGKVFANWLCSVDGETYAEGDLYTMTAEATTFTAQYVAVAQKIIYSLVDGIGSAAVTADQATVTDGTSLVLTNSAGRITITAVTGDTFKNGDAIAFSGTIGNTTKAYGIKYGASNTSLYVAAGQPCSVSGTLSLSSNSNTLVMGRYDGSTTTMTDFVISRTVGVSSESFANVIINGVSATEGTDYTVSGNTITLSKTYFACPVVRISGNATFTDATTGKTNHPVTLALDEDAYTGTTTIAGTTYTVNVPYKGGESIDLSNTTGYNYGFGGYCAPENFTLTGGTAYAAQIVNDKIVLTSYDTEYIPKNTGVIIAGDKGASVTITYTTTTTPNLAFPDNDLKGTTARTATATLKGSASKFLTLQKSTSKFIQYTGEYFPANRAYLLISGESAPESLEMVFADEATAIKEVNAGENANSAIPVKVVTAKGIQIGKYNVAGQQVK